jgi:hypothetical protein
MSDKELSRLEILRDLTSGRLTASAAAELLGLERRQVQRLAKAYQDQGPTALISKKRGRPSNRQTPVSVKAQALAVIRERYADFGPTLAAEKLRELHGITIGRETLRIWMLEAGFWADRQKRRGRVYQPRYRRECVGELVQVDGSEHYWFEDRGPSCTLLVFIDDATSRLMHLQFVQSESTFAYFAATQRYLEAHGKPVAFYTDKHAVFRVNKPAGLYGDGMTQFGRALKALSIEIICANSSQAKGRVERANKTLQDRLVKELRLAGVSTMEDGNAFLPAFMADYNARFAKAPFNEGPAPAHAGSGPAGRSLHLARRADAVAVPHPPVRQHPLPDRTVRVRPGRDRPAGRGRGLPRWPAGGPLQRPEHALSDFRQAAARHRDGGAGEQAARRPPHLDPPGPADPAARYAHSQGPEAPRPDRAHVQRGLNRPADIQRGDGHDPSGN